MELFIESITGVTFKLLVTPLDTINSVKEKIQREEGLPVSQQHLIWRNKELIDSKKLYDYRIRPGATLKLVMGMRVGPINTRRVLLSSPSPVFSGCSTPSLHSSACTSPQPPPPYGASANQNTAANDLSNSPNDQNISSNTQITLLVYKEGNQVNLYRVDKNDAGWLPLIEAAAAAAHSDSSNSAEEFLDQLIQQNITKSNDSKNDEFLNGLYEDRRHDSYQVDEDSEFDDCDNIWKYPPLGKYGNSSDDENENDLYNSPSNLFKSFPSYLNTGASKAFGEYMDCNHPPKTTNSSSSLLDKGSVETDEALVSAETVLRNKETEDLKEKVETIKHKLKEQKLKRLGSKKSTEQKITKCELPNFSQTTPPRATKTDFPRTPEEYATRAPSRPSVHKSPRTKLSLTPISKHEDTGAVPTTKLPSPTSNKRPLTPRSKISSDCTLSSLQQHKKPTLPQIPVSTSATGGGHKPKIFSSDTKSNCKDKNLTAYARKIGAHSVLPNINKDRFPKNVDSAVKPPTGVKGKPPSPLVSPKPRLLLTKSPRLGTAGRRSSSMDTHFEKIAYITQSSQDNSPVSLSTENLCAPDIANKPVRQRCFQCNKKTGLATSFECRCGQNFCSRHRYAELHGCTYDYKAEGRRCIYKNNPLITSTKLPKI